MNIKKSRLRDLQRDIILLSWFATKFIEMPKSDFKRKQIKGGSRAKKKSWLMV